MIAEDLIKELKANGVDLIYGGCSNFPISYTYENTTSKNIAESFIDEIKRISLYDWQCTK